MMNSKVSSLVLLFFVSASPFAVAQTQFSSTDPEYGRLVTAGFEAMQAEDYDQCMEDYAAAFTIQQTSVLSTLRYAACAYSAGQEELYAEQLGIALELDWSQAKGIFQNYEEFEFLRPSEFEDMLVAIYWEYFGEQEGLNRELAMELEEIGDLDQKYRNQIRGIVEAHGYESEAYRAIWDTINYYDSINTMRIELLLDSAGYPGSSQVGDYLGDVAFMVIQHAPVEYQEKYLPMFKEEANKGELLWSTLALMIDRIMMRRGKPQLYGTQLRRMDGEEEYHFAELQYPYQVDSVRATVGLGPIAEYAARFGHTWDPDAHVAYYEAKKEEEE